MMKRELSGKDGSLFLCKKEELSTVMKKMKKIVNKLTKQWYNSIWNLQEEERHGY